MKISISGTELKISTGIIRSNTTDGVAKWLEVHTESEVQMIWELEIGGIHQSTSTTNILSF